MPKHEPVSQEAVLDWLNENHPALDYECDRHWVWVVADLRHDEPTRKSLKDFGFVFARRGGHRLPSGRIGTWGHSCNAPTPFFKGKRKPQTDSVAVEMPAADDATMKELLEFAEI